MKHLPAILLLALLYCCTAKPHQRPLQSIALQPIGEYDVQRLHFIQEQVLHFFNKPVIILPQQPMPASFINTSKGERYSADSIIKWLAPQTNDAISVVVGITNKDIFTTVTNANGQIKQPLNKYAVWGIFGLGYCPGKSAVVSDYRLATNDIQKLQHRLRTVVIHEIGHNLGLPHCTQKSCIMNDANERIQTVDNSADTYCERCYNKIKRVL